ncbi:hypothetical protein C8R45DRAFT_762765, partial [Mycena sanguinolenta]
VQLLIKIILGTGRLNGVGIFGKVRVYYGVVEAQGHGSWHIHLLIWLDHGLSPIEIREKINDPEFMKKAFQWYEDVISHDVPEGTVPFDMAAKSYKGQPVMSRPTVHNSKAEFAQDVRNIMENTAQIHTHSDTCFKYLPKTLKNLKENDKDCRFQLPRDTVKEMHLDDEGSIVLKCNNGAVNGYNPIVVSMQRCNMDVKLIGSGTMAMAMFSYVGNYVIKTSLDTAFMFSALCVGIKAISDSPPKMDDGEVDKQESSRLLMVKTVNQLIGKRELSAQQVAMDIMGWPTKYTNRKYPVFYWTRMLRELSPTTFQAREQIETSDTQDNTEGDAQHDEEPTEHEASADDEEVVV